MGEYSVHSDIFDSLDYLIPPVKKSRGSLSRDLLFSRDFKRQTDIRLIKDFRKKIARPITSPSRSDVHCSSSVILKKTTRELFHEQFSTLNLKNRNLNIDKYFPVEVCGKNCLIKEKPMIKVTVIPKVAETQTSKVFNKRREIPKKLQSTVSNQENSITSQNIYLMVKGKRREKVYEVKATESTKLTNNIFNTKYEDISIQQITNSKRLISSLNMEKKKRKNKKGDQDNFRDNNFDSICSNLKHNHDHETVNSRKSKVRIVGQLGLTRDDQYVLRCAATVNDKPITTNFVQIDNKSRSHINNSKFNRTAETFTSTFKTTGHSQDDDRDYGNFRHRDANDQTDICYANRCMNLNSNKQQGMNSQAIQVNLNSGNYKSTKNCKNQVIQCNCKNILATENNVRNTEDENNALKGCKSPLVIISVYPRQNKDDMVSPVKIIQHPDLSQTKDNNIENSSNYRGKKGQLRNDYTNTANKPGQRSFRSRSPSPATTSIPTKACMGKTIDRGIGKNNRINTLSPPRQKNLNKSSPKLQSMKKNASCCCPSFNAATNQESPKRDENFRVRAVKQTDTKQVKRALVNNFLKSVDRLDQNEQRTELLAPKGDSSRVEININGDRERYDVLFEQRNFNTGLTVRKTLKNSQTQRSLDEIDVNSIENFLMLSNDIKFVNENAMSLRETSEIVPTESRLKIRDSLEICHSRDVRAGSRVNPIQVKSKYDLTQPFYNSDILAPVKHYRGDDCSIPDPNERDKEIRELLGIVRNKRNTENDEHQNTEDKRPEKQKEKGCCCRRKCSSKGLMTGLSISKFFRSKCLKRKPKKQKMLNASTQSKKQVVEDVKNNTIKDPSKKHVTDSIQKSKKSTSDQAKENAIQVSSKKHTIASAPKEKNVSNASKNDTNNNEQVPNYSDSPTDESSPDEVPKEQNAIPTNDKTASRNQDNFATEKKTLKQEPHVIQKKENVGQEPVTTADITRKEPVIEQNLILNRNIQVFLQVEQFTKQRPIILTRKQYDKVKKTIQCTISKNLSVEQRKRCNLKNCNVVSVGEIKVKPKLHEQFHYNREVQTERSEIHRTVRCIQIQTQTNSCRTQTMRTIKKSETSEREINGIVFSYDSQNQINNNKEKHVKPKEITPRQTVSSMEVRYAKVAYMKHITISSTHFGDGFHNNTNNYHDSQKSNTSIHTIFKGHRKSATPNLGTSAYSLCSDVTANNSTNSIKAPPYAGDSKSNKKPFLQRLISCLVMRSAETSILKDVLPPRKQPSVNSSVDSYHISTSLGALEMTSSLYDTSASFYSNHTTVPLNKMKRGFFSSVRGFLTARRS